MINERRDGHGRPQRIALFCAALLLLFAAGCSSPSSGLTGEALQNESGATGGADDADGSGRSPDTEERTVVTRPTVEIPTEWDTPIEEVFGRYWLYWEAFAAAYGPPHVDPGYAQLRELSTDANWASLQEQLDEFVTDEVVLVLPEPSITEHMIRIPNAAVLTGDEGAEVILQDCWIDDFRQQNLDGAVLVETREAKLMNVSMKVVGGAWRVDGVTEATPESDGYEQCEELLS